MKNFKLYISTSVLEEIMQRYKAKIFIIFNLFKIVVKIDRIRASFGNNLYFIDKNLDSSKSSIEGIIK